MSLPRCRPGDVCVPSRPASNSQLPLVVGSPVIGDAKVIQFAARRLRIAVRAAIRAYEKIGHDARRCTGLRRARLSGVSADRRQDAGSAARPGCERQADPRHRIVQEGDHRSDPDPRMVAGERISDRPADGRGVRRVVPRRRHVGGPRRRRRGVGEDRRAA